MSAHESKPQRRKLNEEERALWGRITRSVAPLRRKPVLAEPGETAKPPDKTPDKQKPMPLARPHARMPSVAPASAPQLQPLERRQKQRLARGTEEIDARVDLHGRTQGEAHVALLRFLRRAQADGAKYVLVITGKGARADDGWSERGVLRRQVPLWLRLPEFRPYVVGFEQAHVGHGGEGALYVRVRRVRAG